MSLPLTVEALAFIYQACLFLSGHAVGVSTAQGRIYGVGITVGVFAVESLLPFVQVLSFGQGLIFFVTVDSEDLLPM